MRHISPLLVLLVFSALTAFAVNPVPFVSQPLIPAVARPGGPAFTLTVHGAAFVKGAVVQWNETELATQYVGKKTLQATVTADLIASPTTGLITVITEEKVYHPVAEQLQSAMVHTVGAKLDLPTHCTAVIVGPAARILLSMALETELPASFASQAAAAAPDWDAVYARLHLNHAVTLIGELVPLPVGNRAVEFPQLTNAFTPLKAQA